MPSLKFYAVGADRRAVLDTVFAVGDFALYEMYSEPGRRIRRFRDAQDVPGEAHGPHLMLHVVRAGGQPILDGKAIGGWGLIQLSFGGLFEDRELRWSITNHNTDKRVAKWEGLYPEYGDPRAWDWQAINRASARLNRRIRALAADAIGPHPVLPEAAELIAAHQLTYVYGTGIHNQPAPAFRNS
ncbi:hypothetical protein [Mycobacterium deserti]|uniref:Uncharacterized protein n=1 Tax=Mycobacterium deserti TaxID=2978347 RepID=A0ABT2MKT4_9MYCO|nr:hypothetical protein [Mycobacterium deserti]MCT7662124.1 hypothetical protein [Mycobacterium deserti]